MRQRDLASCRHSWDETRSCETVPGPFHKTRTDQPRGLVDSSRWPFCIIAVALWVAAALPAAAQVEIAISRAEAWLVATQNADGSFGTLADLAPRDSSLTVLALSGSAGAETALTRGAIYLQGVPESNTDFRSLRALALAATGRGVTPLLDSLLGFSSGGGMGAFGYHQPTLLDTGLAVEALSLEESARLLDVASLLDFLQLHQAADRGWGLAPDLPSEVYYTSEILRALAGLEELSVGGAVLDGGAAFLLGRQQADGGFGSVIETAMVYRALLDLGTDPGALPWGSPVPYLLARQLAVGSWESDAFTTAQVILALRKQRPNLVIAVLDAPESVAPGLPIRITVTVRNTGPEPAPASQLDIRFDDAGGELAATAPIEALAPGAEAEMVLDLDASGREGSVELFALADAASEITEVDEDDNVASASVTLRAGPDLALFAEDLSLVPATPEPDQSFEVLVSARNLGETEVATFGYRLTRLVGGAPAEVLAAGSDGPIDAGGGRLLTLPLTLPEGEHTLEMILDPDGLTDEENESNNRATLTFFVVDRNQPDLAVADADLVLTPAEPQAGGMVEVSVTVTNLGGIDAAADLVLLENDSPDGGVELRRVPLTLAAGESETVIDTVPLSAGAYALTAVVDPDGTVAETDESNNRVIRVFRDLPDLAIGFDNFEILTASPLEGDPVEVSLTVRNAGTATATGVAVEVTAGGSQVFSGVLPEIPPAGNAGVGFTWTATAGLTTLIATADPGDAILETSEANNQAERQVAVPRPSGPDLEITSIDRSGLSESAQALTISGSVDVTIANSGDAEVTAPFQLRLFEDRDGDRRFDSGEPVLGSAIISDPPAAGTTLTVSVAVDARVAFHHPLAWVEVDASDVIAEQREDNNKTTLFGDCELPPASGGGVATPIEEWFLAGVEVQTAPVVVQLSDDNGDGRVDSRDTPDVVFHTIGGEGNAILAVSGLDGTRLWAFRSTPANPLVGQLGQVAAADLDGDGVAEVLGHQRNGRLLALEHTGELKWVSDVVEGIGNRGLGGPAIGDLSGDGVPEIVLGRAVLSNAGKLIALGTANRGQNRNYYGPFGVVLVPGATAYPQSLIADVDLDGNNELVAGDAVYRLNGNALEVVWNATVPDRLMDDGFSAVANLDSDPEAEIVYVSSGQIMIRNHDGSTKAGRREMVGFSPFTLPTFWGGAPTIADLDGDGTPEILVVTATRLIAYRANLSQLWRRDILEDFGGLHSVTAFDLDGDDAGVREVFVIADNAGSDARTFYILDGATGAILHSRPNISKTGMEYTVVADVDGDGRAELLVPSTVGFSGDASTQGLHVLGHPSWQGTRPIWNQYSYHVTNVLLDGTVPSPQVAPWQASGDAGNVFRGNRELPSPPLLAANLTVSFPRVGSATPEGVPVTVRVGNGGREAVGAGVVVELFDGDPVTGVAVAAGVTTRGLLPGGWQDLTMLWTAAGAGGVAASAIVDRADLIAECDESDNTVDFTLDESVLPDLSIPAGGITVPGAPTAGQVVDLVVTVDNAGNAAAGTFTVRLFDGQPGLGPVIGETVAGPLAVGESRAVTVSWDTLGFAGIHLVHAVVDPDGELLEQEEGNNQGIATVELDVAELVDLSAEDFTVEPASLEAGTPAFARVRVLNRGAAADEGFAAAFLVNNAEAGRRASPGILATGEELTLELEHPTFSLGGTVALEVRLDPDGELSEENEANNSRSTELEVTPASLAAAVATDRRTYQGGETVAIEITAQNLGATTRELLLLASIVDPLGAEVAELAAQVLSLAPGSTGVALTWDTGTSLPGSYAAMAELYENDSLKARGSALFSIAGQAETAATLFTDRDVYTPQQAAILLGNVRNLSDNMPLADLTARLAVAGTGGEVFALERDLLALFPDSDTQVNGLWEIANAPAGTYTASLSLRDALGALLSYASTTLEVEDSAETGAGLTGDLSVAPELLGAGAPLLVTYEVGNGGNADIPDLDLRFDLVRLADGAVADSLVVPQPLAREETARGSLGFLTTSLEEGDYLATLVAVLPGVETRLDRAGFSAGPGVSIADAASAEGDGGTVEITFDVSLSSALAVPVSVAYATADGTALAPADYLSASGTVTFQPGETLHTVSVTVFGDLEPEPREVFVVGLADPSGVLLGDSQALGTIIDEEGCASPDLLVNADAEQGDPLDPTPGWTGEGFERRFGAPPPLSGLSSFAYGGDSAFAELHQDVDVSAFATAIDAGGQEFLLEGFVRSADEEQPDAVRLLIEYRDAANQTVLEVFDSGEVASIGHWQSVVERRPAPAGTRVLRLRLETARYSGEGTDVYVDRLGLRSLATPTVTIGDAAVTEGDPGTGTVRVVMPVVLSCSPGVVTLDYLSADGSGTGLPAAIAGSDYQAASGTLVLAAGETSGAVEVEVTSDLTDEPDESFTVELGTGAAVVLLDPAATGTILDDDGPVAVSIAHVNATEGDPEGAGADAVFIVSLSSISGRTVSVDYLTTAGTALDGSDYVSASGTLTLAPGTGSLELPVALIGDRLSEPDESFTVELSDPVNATLGAAAGTATIFDNDVVEISVDDPSVVEGDGSGAQALFTVTLSLPSTLEVTVAYATADAEALAGDDYTAAAGSLSFAPGELSRSVEVPILSDLVREPLESFRLVLSSPANALLGDPEGTATIIDDDGLLISVGDVTVQEGDSGTADAVFQVSLQKAGIEEVTVDYQTLDGTALAGVDYAAVAGTLTFPAGTTLAVVPVPVSGDLEDEPGESFFLMLANATNGIILDGEGEATVVDNDGWFTNSSASEVTIPGCVVLTPDATYRRGSAWRTTRLDLSHSFDKTFRVYLGSRTSGGEGIVFVLHNDGTTALGSTGSYLGYNGIAPSIGFELDSYAGSGNHFGVDLNGSNSSNPILFTSRIFEDGNEHLLRVVWNAALGQLDAHYDGDEIVIYPKDVVSQIFGGNPEVYWGFTGATSGRNNLQYFCATEICRGTAGDPMVSIGDLRLLEGDTGDQDFVFPVTLSCPTDHVVTVDFATADGTATAGEDYTAASGTVTFLPGETSHHVTVAEHGDDAVEDDETFTVQLSNAAGGAVRYAQGEATILTDDIQLVVNHPILAEGESGIYRHILRFSLTSPPVASTTVTYATADGSAGAGSDYLPISGTLVFSPGTTSHYLTVQVVGDTQVEGDEDFFVTFSGPAGGQIDSSVRLTLLGDDDCSSPNLLVNGSAEVPLVGGEIPGWQEVSGWRWTYRTIASSRAPFDGENFFFPGVAPNAELRQDVDVSLFAGAVDAGTQLFEFLGVVQTAAQNPRDTSRIIVEYRDQTNSTVLARFDTGEIYSPSQWRAVQDLRHAPAGTRKIRVRLISKRRAGDNNDGEYDAILLRALPAPGLTAGGVSVVEGNTGQTEATFTVALNCDRPEVVAVDYLTADGSAGAGSDYQATFGTLTYQPGEVAHTVTVPVFGDTQEEGDETFSLNLLNPAGALLYDPVAVGTILDDESLLSIADVTVVEGFEGTVAADFLLTLAPTSDQTVTVRFHTADGTATAGSDYLAASGVLTFSPGQTQKTVTVEVSGDIEVESDETFFVDLVEPNNAGIADDRGVGTILQDDTVLSIGDARVIEGHAGTTGVRFPVTLSTASPVVVTVDYSTTDGLALAGVDYTGASGTLTFEPGETEKTLTVLVHGDTEIENSETFFVLLENPAGASLGQVEGTGFILDDDDCPSPNLLLNPGAEEPLAGGEIPAWVEALSSGWTRRTSNPSALEGSGYFYAGTAGQAELRQDVDVSGYAAYVDAGIQRFTFDGFVRSAGETPPDTTRIVLEYRDESNTLVLDSFDSGEIAGAGDWQQVAELRTAQPGTRFIRVRLIAQRFSGGTNDGYFDALSLRSLGTPVLSIDDPSANEGDPGSAAVELPFAVSLTCAADEAVTVGFATADREALAGIDYVAAAGTLTLPAGSTSGTIAVEVIGDLESEPREQLEVSLSSPTVAVLFDPQGIGTLVDDESEPQVDLRLTKLAERSAIRPGEELDFFLEVRNRGVDTAQGLVLVDVLPPHLLFVAASAGGTFDPAAGTVTWSLPSLAPQSVASLTLTVRAESVLPFGDTVVNTATVTDDGSLGADDNPADNTAEAPLLLWDGTGPLVEGGFNLGRSDRAEILPSSESSFEPATQAFDGDLASSWQVDCGDAVNRGGSPFLEVRLPAAAVVRGLGYFADRKFSGHDFLAGRFELFSAIGDLLYDTGEIQLVPPRDLLLDLPDTVGVRRVRFTPTADTSCNPALAELLVIGGLGDGESARGFEGETLYGAALMVAGTVAAASGEVDWGDGVTTPGSLLDLGERALLEAEHAYRDDGLYPAELCITDSGAVTGCTSLDVRILNVAPDVNDDPQIDLRLWQVEDYEEAGETPSDWVVAADGRSVTQRNNPVPSVFYGDFEAVGRRIEGTVRVNDNEDNDQLGFVLGFEPGDTDNVDAEFIVIDWREETELTAQSSCVGRSLGFAGLAVSRVFGIPDFLELWGKLNFDCNGLENGVEELARGQNLGNVGWQRFTDYHFAIEYDRERLRVFVDGVLEIDLEGQFPDGLAGFFDQSQRQVVFRAFQQASRVVDEGSTIRLDAPFTDPGVDDTHTATVDWGDGAVMAATIEPGTASLRAVGEHAWVDNLPDFSEYPAVVCVDDDDGGTDCGTFPILVRNAPPQVDTGADLVVRLASPTELAAAFTDAGLADVHTATVDWGDGTVLPAVVTATGPGAGAVAASHLYAALGTYAVEVCVTDDDGGVGCDSLLVEVLLAVPASDVAITVAPSAEGEPTSLTASFTDSEPGDTHTATVDWGDGTVPEPVAVTPSPPSPDGSGGTLVAGHRYLDDGPYTVEVCVTDLGGNVGCATAEKAVANLVPLAGRVDLRRFVVEDGLYDSSNVSASSWTVSPEGHKVREGTNSLPTFLYSSFSALGTRASGYFRLEGDDDYVGFAMGFEPGDTVDPEADYLLVAWKQAAESGSVRGLRAYRVRGVPEDFFTINQEPEAELLATGATLGNVGWVAERDYPFTAELTAGRFRVWIDGTLEIDIAAPAGDPFRDGRFALYTFAQVAAVFRDVRADAADPADERPAPPPELIDLASWAQEDIVDTSLQAGNWVRLADGRGIEQRANSRATVFYSDFDLLWTTAGAIVRPLGDNDYIGFTLGFDPGDFTNPDADYLLVVWKQKAEASALRGLRVYRIQGVSNNNLFRIQQSSAATLLATGATLGNVGYTSYRNYDFRFRYQADRFRMWVNDSLEVDVAGQFEDGRFGFYSMGMLKVRFRDAYREVAAVLNEGDTVPDLVAPFTDEGILDFHTASVDWGDATPVEAASVVQVAGAGSVTTAAGHLLADDVVAGARYCVTDDDGGTGCGELPIRALNLPPVVDAGPNAVATITAPFSLTASFSDPGTADTHTASVDWGDGTTESVAVDQGAGSGTVGAEHAYAAAGTYTATVCVTDDDGGAGCDTTQVTVTTAPPVLEVAKTDSLVNDAAGDGIVNPGDVVGYQITVVNSGGSLATAVALSDIVPEHTVIVAGSVAAVAGTVVSEDPVQVDLASLAPGATATVTFEVTLATLPAGVTEIANQAVVSSTELADVASDDPDTAAPGDPTVTPVAGNPELVAAKTDALLADNDSDAVPSPGDVVRYTITVENTGGGGATGVVLRDLVPENTVLVPGSVTTTGTVVTESPVEVEIGTLAAGASVEIAFDVTIDNPFPAGVADVSNQGTVTSDQLPAVLTDDPDVGGDADPTVTMVTASPLFVAEKSDDLAIDADGDGAPSPGDTIGYAVTLKNLGNTAATGVQFLDLIPEHTAMVAGSLSASAGTVITEDPVEVDVGLLAVGDVVTVTFRVTVVNPIPAGVAEVINQGAVAADGLDDVLSDDPDLGGDADPTVTPITAAPVLTVEKTNVLFSDPGGDSAASPGDELLYSVTVANSGNTGAMAVRLTDTVPANTALVTGTVQTSQGTVVTEDPVDIDLGQVDAGTTATVTFRVTVDDPFPVESTEVANQATVESAELDPVASDDPDTEPTGDATATEVFITPEVTIDDVAASEGDPGDGVEAAFTVSLSESGNRPVTVTYQTAAGSATEGLDYQSAAGSVVFAPGETTHTVTVPVIGDLLDEPDETFTVELTSADAGNLADDQGLGTILDDDPPPAVSVTGVTVTEGDSGTVDAIFALTLSAASGFDVTVDYLTADATATAGLDYQAMAGSVVFAAGSQVATIAVPVASDLIDEPDETFLVQLTGAVHGVLAVAIATGEILDDDEPPALAIGDVTVNEGNPGDAVEAVFNLSLSLESGWEISADYATMAGTAVEGSDYEPVAGTVILPPGTTAATVTVPVASDQIDEPDETFSVELSGAVRVTLADASGLGTILDDDDPPILSVTDVTVTEGMDPAAVFNVSLSLESGFDVTVDYQTADGAQPAAIAGLDYSSTAGGLGFPAGTTGATVSVPILEDALDEDNEAFTLALSNAVMAQLPVAPAIGTILDDDPLPAASIDDVTVVEGDSGTTQMAFTVSLSAVSGRQVSIDYATAEGTADAGEDYATAGGTLSFAPGETSQEVLTYALTDDYQEAEETFTVLLSAPVNVAIADGSGLGTIIDDDVPLLVASKTDLLLEESDAAVIGQANPGDVLRYEITLENLGTGIATGVAFDDLIPLHTRLVAGSVTVSAGTIESEDPIHVPVGEVAIGETVAIGFDVAIDNPLAGDVEILNQGIVTSIELPDLLTDDSDLPGEQDPTVTLSVGCEYGLEVEFAEGCGTVFIPATCGDCDGKVTELTLEYLGDAEGYVEVVQKKDSVVVFAGTVQPGEPFSFTGQDNGTLSTEITIYVDGILNARMHTSCSNPIGPGMVRGDFLVLEGTSRNGGPLCPLPEGGLCGDCDGKVTRLTLEYLGTKMDAYVEVVQKKDSVVVFAGTVQPGDQFSFAGEDDGTLSTEITIYVDGAENTRIHTSCSQPVGPGLVSGDFLVTFGQSRNGGPLCSLVDLGCGECDGNVSDLTIRYQGVVADWVEVFQEDGDSDSDSDSGSDSDSDSDSDSGGGSDPVLVFAGTVQPSESFSFAGINGNGTLGTEITIYTGGIEHTRIHTSCSQPVGPGLISGDFLVIDGESRHGGPLCPLPPECGVAGVGVLNIDGDTVEWQLTNVGRYTATIESIHLVWPEANGDLEKVKLDSKEIASDQRPPPQATIDGGWSGQLEDRQIEKDQARTLKLEFALDAVPGNEICDCCGGDSDSDSDSGDSDSGGDSDSDSDSDSDDAGGSDGDDAGGSDKTGDVAGFGWIAHPAEAGDQPPVVADRPRWAGAVAERLLEVLLLLQIDRP